MSNSIDAISLKNHYYLTDQPKLIRGSDKEMQQHNSDFRLLVEKIMVHLLWIYSNIRGHKAIPCIKPFILFYFIFCFYEEFCLFLIVN